MHDSVEHTRPKYTREILLIWLRSFTREDADKLAAPIVFLHCLVNYVPKLDEAALPERLLVVGKLIGKLLDYPFANLIHLWIQLVAVHKNLVCTGRRNLYLSA